MPRRAIAQPQRWRGTVGSGVATIVPDKHRPYAAELYVNGTPQSHVDLLEPEYLAYEYVRHIGDVLDLAFPPARPIRALHLGGGALTLPRYVAATRPRSRQRVVELDEDLVALVRQALPLPPRSGIRVSSGDARRALERVRPASVDAVVVDAYAGPRMPANLASREALVLAAHALRAPGVLVVNLADGRPLSFAKAMVATALQVAESVGVVGVAGDASVWRGRRFGNLVLVLGAGRSPWDALRRRLAGGPFPARLVTGADLAAFASGAAVVTDATTAPSPQPPPDAFD